MSYKDVGFDQFIIRSGYAAEEQEYFDQVNIGDMMGAGAVPVEAIIGDIPQENIEGISIYGWVTSMGLSVIDYDTVQWSAGSITLADGTVFTIDAGNTENMTVLTYIYFDKSVSETVLQTTTTGANAVG